VGVEIGWYLRFKRGHVIQALVQPQAAGQVENLRHMEPDWSLETVDRGTYLEVTLKEKTP
jgi:hypothetical protein